MGTKDSSKTRVAPVFDWLLGSDPSGASWVNRLLALGSRTEAVSSLPTDQKLIDAHGRRWGTDERGLAAPLGLLEYLVQHVDRDLVESSGDSGTVLTKRRALADQDPRTIADALGQLRSGKRGRRWYVLEGESRPDAMLETGSLVVCIEGKRTESKCTSSTTWMRCRSQLVRHMDSAMAHYGTKRVVGLLIVEGEGGASAIEPSPFWKGESQAQYAPAMLDGSLPHRGPEERRQIADGVLGVTTWQAVCAEFGIPWPPVADAI